MSDDNTISDDDKEAQKAAQEYYKNNFSGQTPVAPPAAQSVNDDNDVQKSAQEYVKSLNPQISTPAVPLVVSDSQKGNKPRSTMNPDYDQGIKDSLGLGGFSYGAYLGHKDLPLPGSAMLSKLRDIGTPGASYNPAAIPDQTPTDTSLNTSDTYDSDIDKILQSQRANESEPTGRQMMNGSNWQSNADKLRQEQYLANNPGAKQALINAPNMIPDKVSGIALSPTDYAALQQERALKKAQQTYADQQAAAVKAAQAEDAAKTAQTVAKSTGFWNGIGNTLSKGLGVGTALYSGYDTLANARDKGFGDVGTWTKALSTAGGLAMLRPSIPSFVGGLAAQIPEQTRQMVEDVKNENPKIKRNAALDWGNSGLD